MFKKILVPLDGSELAERALAPALALARAVNGEVILLSVTFLKHIFVNEPAGYGTLWPDQSMAYTANELRTYLQTIAHDKDHANVNLRPVVLEGDEASAIVDTAIEEEVDLIVMSTHGRSGFSRWVLGSVTERVLRSAPCPVLVVRSTAPLGHVMITLDGSELAERALAPGLEIARSLGAQVTLFRVEPQLEVDPRTVAELEKAEKGLGERMRQELYEAAQHYLQSVGQPYEAAGQQIETIVDVGQAARCILDFAENENVDLIVTATHGHTGLRRWVYGSVTEKVLRGARSALMVVRPPAHELKINSRA